ncbi:hypothetical protein KCU77_g11816, partial [Aureobasidium melanogenum]
MVDYSKGLWQPAEVYAMMSDHPETIVLKFNHKEEPKSFVVNKAVLCYYSTYFEKTFNGFWKESRECKNEFEVDLSQADLRLFHGWLHTGRILSHTHIFKPDHIIRLWQYGDYIGCLALRRTAMSHLQRSSADRLRVKLVSYDSLHCNNVWIEYRDSALYQFIIDVFAFHWDHGKDAQVEDPVEEYDIPNTFLYDQMVIRSKYAHIIKKGLGLGDCPCCTVEACKYHEHSSGDERDATCGCISDDLRGLYVNDDADDINDEESESEHEDQDIDAEKGEEITEVDFNAFINESINTCNDTEAAGTDVNGKRKAYDDGQEEEVPAKKLKQEADS